MSKRVSIVLPDAPGIPTRSRSPSGSKSSSRRSSTASAKSALKSPRGSTAGKSLSAPEPEPEPKPAPEPEPKAPAESSESALVKLSMTDLFSDGCERYTKDCCCCHCIAVRRALRQAAFLKTPEGKQRLELKMHLKNLLMDINSITATRDTIQNRLHGTKEYPPPATKSFPITITHVAPISSSCMSIEWYLHDDSNIVHYEIYVDNARRKRVFNPQLTSTVVLDVDMKRTHKIRMRAVPRKCLGARANPIDRLVRDVCCGGLDRILEADYFCDCAKKNELEKIKENYKKNSCQKLVDFWKDSEFLYIPICDCRGACTCDCFAENYNACS